MSVERGAESVDAGSTDVGIGTRDVVSGVGVGFLLVGIDSEGGDIMTGGLM